MDSLNIPQTPKEIEFAVKSCDQRLSQLDKRLASISNIESIDIENDVNLKFKANPASTTHSNVSINQAHLKNEQLTITLKQLNKLWLIKGLINEIEINLSVFEFESVFYSLEKLERLVADLKLQISDPNMSIIQSIEQRYSKLKNQSQSQLLSIFHRFINISSTEAYYYYEKLTENDIELHFMDVYNLVSTLPSLKNENLQVIFSKIPDYGFRNIQYEYESNLKLHKLIFTKPIDSFEDVCNSTVSLVKFMDNFPLARFKNYISSKIITVLNDKVYENISEIYKNDYSIKLLEETIQFSKSKGFNVKVNNVNDLYIDSTIDNYIESIRNVFLDEKSFEFGEFVDNVSGEEPTSSKKPEVKLLETKAPGDPSLEEDEDTWNEWADEIDLNIESPKSIRKESKESKAEDTEWNDWDEWNDEVKIDEVELDISVDNPAITNTGKEQYQISKIPSQITSIVQRFQQDCLALPEDCQSEFISKISYIETTIMAISFKYKNFFLKINDLSYLASQLEFNELSTYCLNKTNQKLKIWHSEISSLTKIDLIVEWFERFINSDYKTLNSRLFNFIVIELFNLTNNEIIGQIVDGETTGDLYELQNSITKLTNYEKSLESKSIKVSYNKLSNILKFLNYDSNQVLNDFYNGDFFEFSTSEIINLIKRYNSENNETIIKEIIDIRNTA